MTILFAETCSCICAVVFRLNALSYLLNILTGHDVLSTTVQRSFALFSFTVTFFFSVTGDKAVEPGHYYYYHY